MTFARRSILLIALTCVVSSTFAHEQSEHNKIAVWTFYEVFAKGNLNDLDDMLSPEFVDHGLLGQPSDSRALIKQRATALRQAFTRFGFDVRRLIAEGDQVVVFYLTTGKHDRPFMGATATGNAISAPGIALWTVTPTELREVWELNDEMTLRRQIGALANEEPKPDTKKMANSITREGRASTPIDEMKQIAQWAVEDRWAGGLNAAAAVDEMYDAKYENHAFGGAKDMRAALRERSRQWRDGFTQLTCEVIDLVAEGEYVAAPWTVVGTHSGAYGGVAATGKRVTMSGHTIYRVRQSRIVEEWTVTDEAGLRWQLGAL
ncbi:MAG: ester cyclase family protein [Candidatus Poribacteria bacterium]|nr:ester cyclase family protein [Candidatus Poribacteria bacterium]